MEVQLDFVFQDQHPHARFLQQSEEKRWVVVGIISRILTIRCNSKTLPWLELQLGELKWPPNGRFLQFKFGNGRYYLPLGWNGWTIARRISLSTDPTTKRTIYNYRAKWFLGDRWPGCEYEEGREEDMEEGD